jgi:IS4 transposase
MDFYLRHLKEVRKNIPQAVRYGVFDGAFARKKFVSGVRELGLHVVSKLRSDANLRYLYQGPQQKRGRRKLYEGKVLFNDLSRWQSLGPVAEHLHLYTVRAHHVSLQRVVRVVLLLCDKVPGKPRYVLLFSSDEEMEGQDVYRLYKARFQMEYLFRDSKQWTGLSDCQARDEQALHFHFNAALTAVNVMKVQTQAPTQPLTQARKDQRRCSRGVFSLASCKQRCYNEHLLETFIHNLDLEPSWVQSHPRYQDLCNYGAIAY